MIHNTDTIRKRFSSRIAPCPFFLGIARRRMWGAAPRPALAAVRLGGQSWRAAPLSCPHSSGSGRSCRVKGSPRLARVLASLRAAPARRGRFAPLTRHPLTPRQTPQNGLRRVFSQKAWNPHDQTLRSPSRLVSGFCGGIGGVAPDGGGCFAAIKSAPGMNAGNVLRKPLPAFAPWKAGFYCA